MPELIRNGQIEADNYSLITDADTSLDNLPEGPVIVPMALWKAQKAALKERHQLGVWLNSDQPPAEIADDLAHFQVIAINFPGFADGRGFSYARELRESYGYQDEIRAIGKFMRDQLFYLSRCGFNAYALETSSDEMQAALASLAVFSETYQAACDRPEPLFRRRSL